MDFSPSTNRLQPTKIILPDRPLSPWVRIAGAYSTGPDFAVDYAKLRTIEDFEIILQVEGRTWTWIEPYGSIDIGPGDIIFNPPGVVHGWAYGEGAHMAVHFDFHANPNLAALDNLRPIDRVVYRKPAKSVPTFAIDLPGASNPLVLPFVTPAGNSVLWKSKIAEIIDAWSRDRSPSLRLHLLYAEIVGWMVKTLAEDAVRLGLAETRPEDAAISKVLKNLEELALVDQAGWLSLTEMAKLAGLGLSALHERFLQATGQTPRRFQEKRRIDRAKRLLLETNHTVADIGRSQGYEDVYYFSRAFKRSSGKSPAQFRKFQ